LFEIPGRLLGFRILFDATFAKDRKDKAKETTLTKLLSWLSVRNFFMLSHIPPKIVLDYRQQCHFPQSLNYP